MSTFRTGSRGALRSAVVRVVWIVAVVLLVIGLGAWATTCTGPRPLPTGETVTNEVYSALRVLDYDPTYREWQVISLSDVITGTASPLPAFDRTDPNRANAFNGADLLKTGGTVFLARTTTVDGRAHLYMWAWDRDKREAAPIKMAGPDGVERDLDISGDLDVKVADLDNDLLYEVVADNLAGVEVWSWDGTKYVLKGGR